jgi:hypothetical protein
MDSIEGIVGHIIVIFFWISAVIFAFITYILYENKVNRGLAAVSLFVTITLLVFYLYFAYLLATFGGFF